MTEGKEAELVNVKRIDFPFENNKDREAIRKKIDFSSDGNVAMRADIHPDTGDILCTYWRVDDGAHVPSSAEERLEKAAALLATRSYFNKFIYTTNEPTAEEGEVIGPPKSGSKVTLVKKTLDALAGVYGVTLVAVGFTVVVIFRLLWIALKIGFVVFVVWVILKLLGIA